MYYGNVVIGWSEEGFQKAEEDKTTKKVVDIDPGQSRPPITVRLTRQIPTEMVFFSV